MRHGTLVMLIGTDGYMPPLGAVGVIVWGPDATDDYDVFFADHPWSQDPRHCGKVSQWETDDWSIPGRWLMPVGDDAELMVSGQEQVQHPQQPIKPETRS